MRSPCRSEMHQQHTEQVVEHAQLDIQPVCVQQHEPVQEHGCRYEYKDAHYICLPGSITSVRHSIPI